MGDRFDLPHVSGSSSGGYLKALRGRLAVMPRPYPQEFRARAIALVRAGKQAKQTAARP